VQLLTNNPKKVDDLRRYGIRVQGRIPHVIPANEYNRFYLQTKANRSGHLIDFDGKPPASEQNDPVVVDASADQHAIEPES
jgi:GTP cyclohydrolase II